MKTGDYDDLTIVPASPVPEEPKFLPTAITPENCPSEFAPVKWILDQFLPGGVLGGFVAEGGTGKSWSLLEIAFCAAYGFAFLRPERKGQRDIYKVVYFNGEDSNETIQRRLRELLNKYGEVEGGNLKIYPMAGRSNKRFTSPDVIENYLKEIPEGTDLVIFDPASQFFMDDAEEKNTVMGQFIDYMTKIREHLGPDATVLLSHHMSKAGSASGSGVAQTARGSSAFTDGLRWVATMTPYRPKDKLVRVKVAHWDTSNFEYPPLIRLLNAKNNNHAVFRPMDIYQGRGGTFRFAEDGEEICGEITPLNLTCDGCEPTQYPEIPSTKGKRTVEKKNEPEKKESTDNSRQSRVKV
ncbi:helicase RepA family protein [Myxococcota bacterium]|nr:helicase RepA family protein [Myxococcota bacterium]MBU1382888.1 helicase RepA family protein [Myxococcota bacterium]MBU1496694.1 helicase RepA family protein [Myxococcota bacterium]